MAQDLLFPGNILSLHRAAVDKLARQGDGDAALLYLVLAAGGNSGALPWGPEKVEGAKNTLIQLGLLPSDAAVLPPVPQKLEDDRPPEYTSQDIAQALQDRKGEAFPVEPAWGCRNELFNAKTLWLADKADWKTAGLTYARLAFLRETPADCAQVFRAYRTGAGEAPAGFTRGLYYRGVE